jgi:hypothetical protein
MKINDLHLGEGIAPLHHCKFMQQLLAKETRALD